MACQTLDRHSFARGEVIFNLGEPPQCAYLIQAGAVDIVLGREGEGTVVDTLTPGEFFGEMALVDNEPRSATARAREHTTCIRVSRRDFQDRLETVDPLTRAMLKLLVKRLRKATQLQHA
jgi:CRP/FNR family cyclic AMP-dependent transcriptional regulator